MKKFKCDTNNIRLDKFLVEKIPDITRSQLQKLIKSGNVKVNGKESSVHNFLKQDDKIEVTIKQKGEIRKKKNIELNIVFENDDFLVINKPAGIIVHQYEGLEEYSLADAIIKKYPKIKKVGEDPNRPGIVHRLDKDVSGLMVVAKNNKAFLHLKKQFQKRKVGKEYIALVHGKIINQSGSVKFPIGRSKTKKHRMAALPVESEKGKEAYTEYELIKYYKNYSLLKVNLHTGRTHQIRVHMNSISYPVVGDKVYKNNKIKDKLSLGRIFLHSYKLAFVGPDKKQYEFYQYLPVELKQILNKINENNIFIVVSGPSGVGKTTIISKFLNNYSDKFDKTTTYTTREKREGDKEEKYMFHITDIEFEKMIAGNKFLEWEHVHGLYYGTDLKSFSERIKNKNIITSIDVKGTKIILEKIPEAYTIFINYKSIKQLDSRLRKRGDLTEERIKVRKQTAMDEIEWEYIYDYIVRNDEGKLDKAVKEFDLIVKDIITKI